MALNQCSFIGNLGADPEIRSFQNGGRVANLRIAVTEKWKDKEGNRKEATEWVTVAILQDGLVGVAERYLKKGSKVFIQGKLRTRKWHDQSGNDRYSTEISVGGMGGVMTMLDGAQGGGGGGGGQRGGGDWNSDSGRGSGGGSSGGGWNQGGQSGGGSNYDDLDDDIPF